MEEQNVGKEPEVQKNVEEPKVAENTTATKSTFEPIQQSDNKKTKKKSKKGGIIALLVLLVVIVAAAVGAYFYYTKIFTNPQKVYQKAVKNGLNSLTANSITEEIKTLDANFKFDVELDLEDKIEDEIEDIIDLINNTQLELDVQFDKENKQIGYGIGSKYKKDDLINANILLDVKKERLYMQLDQFFDKTLKMDIEDEEAIEVLEELFEIENSTFKDENAKKKALSIIEKEFNNLIKEEYCSKDKEKITIDSKEKNVDVYTLKMSAEQLVKEFNTVVKNLKDNDKFLDCYKDSNAVKEGLEKALEPLEELKDAEDFDKLTIKVKIYANGLKQDIVRVDIVAEAEDEKIVCKIEKEDEAYKLELIADDEKVLSCKVQNKENSTKIQLDINEVGKITLNAEYKMEINKEIKTIETKGAVDIQSLTEKDIEKATKKLEDSKLYDLVESFGGMLNDDYEIEDEDDDVSTIPSTNLTTKDNEIKTYTSSTLVSFKIPEGYKSIYASDTYKTFSKDTTTVDVNSYYGNKEEYAKKVQRSIESLKSREYYKDVKNSEEKTMKVGEKTFYYVEVTYTSDLGYNHTKIYIYTDLNDSETYVVEINATDLLENLDVKDFLEIK